MPLRKKDIKGKTLQEIKELLRNNIKNLSDEDIKMVWAKVEKRYKEGDKISDDEMLNELYGALNLED